MRITQYVSIAVLAVIFSFLWGVITQRYHTYPYPYVQELLAYYDGSVELPTSLLEKLENDNDIRPARWLVSDGSKNTDLAPMNVQDLQDRRRPPVMMLKSKIPVFRLIVGAFDFKSAFWGAILIDEHGVVVHQWALLGEKKEPDDPKDFNRVLYGVGILPDGSIVYNLNGEHGLMRRDVCSRLLWEKEGIAHHVASIAEDGKSVWTFKGSPRSYNPVIEQVDIETGKVTRQITVDDIQEKNPDLFIFDLRHLENTNVDPEIDFPHANDIKPLPSHMAAAFPQFSAGDLVVNYRTSNLMFVLDPDSLKVKFWYFGAADGGHDVDWQPNGTFSLFNNHWRHIHNTVIPGYSSIVSINSLTHTHQSILSGKPYNLYSSIVGKHQITQDNTVLIASGTQGRVIEIDMATGEVVFEFINTYDAGKALFISDAFYLPKDFFDVNITSPDLCKRNIT